MTQQNEIAPDMAQGGSYAPTDRSRIRRNHKRAVYDRTTIHAIVDATPLCHIGYVIDGQPFVTPTLHWRDGETLYWHGSSASRMLKAQKGGIPVCVTVTHFDGLVLARTAFEHTANFRTAILYGKAEAITGSAEKNVALHEMMNLYFPGRMAQLRENTDKELKATSVMRMEIEDAVAKVNNGPPEDDEDGLSNKDVWAGVLPRTVTWGTPEPDEHLSPDVPVPVYPLFR